MKKKKKLPDIKPKYTLELDEDQLYSLGGWLKTAAGAGAMFIPGMQGVGAGLLGAGIGDILSPEEEEVKQIGETRMPRTVGKVNMTPNVAHFNKGGYISKKIPILMNEGYPQKQAIAIAYSMANKKKIKQGGGMLNGMDNEQMYGKRNPLLQMEGNLHEGGGIDFLPDAEVQGGETIINNVVNSDDITITKDIAKQYKLPKKAIGKTVADYSKNIEDQFEGRDGDPFAMNTRNRMMSVVSRMSAELADEYEDQGIEAQYGKNLGLPPIFNPSKLRDWNDRRRNIPRLGWDKIEKGERWDPYQNQNMSLNNVPVWNNNMNNQSFSTVPHTQGFTPLDIGELSVPTDETNTDFRTPAQSGYGNGRPNVYDKQFETGIPERFKYNAPDILSPFEDVKGVPGAVNVNMPNVGGNINALRSYSGTLPDVKTGNKITEARGNTGGTGLDNLLGLAPIAMSAFNAARASMDKPERVNIAPIHPAKINPKLIDPEYQLREVSDVYATGNEAMKQVSKKDYMRRRIQSATEEAKTKSGVLGQAAATNVGIRNRADEINQSNELRADMFNIEAGLQEENINAANMGAYQTNRDFQRNNLATMMGEYARDTNLTKSQETYNNRYFNVMENMFPNQSLDRDTLNWNITGSPLGVDSGYVFPNSAINNPTQQPIAPQDAQYQGADLDFNSSRSIWNRYNTQRIPRLYRSGR